jgi:hypothetical protein
MMKPNLFKFILVTSLVALSVVFYFVQCLIFHNLHDMLSYLLQNVAFLPLQVLLVTLILERVLRSMEKQERINKQNMVIGTFFSQFGVPLLARFSNWDTSIESARAELLSERTGRMRNSSPFPPGSPAIEAGFRPPQSTFTG